MSHFSRRSVLALGTAALAAPAFAAAAVKTEQWGMLEIALKGPMGGNPFMDVTVSAVFESGGKTVEVPGFYDGDGIYRIRFMPDRIVRGRWRTKSNAAELDGKTGSFDAAPPAHGNHGPVVVANTFHFAYSDGTPCWPLGTTSYACIHQSDARIAETLKTLAASPFNKLRVAVFPNSSTENFGILPFVGKPLAFDFTRFNPVFFRRLDNFVAKLMALGIEADVILFHPYDGGKWGFDAMPPEVDERYVRYLAARLSAYRNVWWSMANEYDQIKAKNDASFDRLFQIVQGADPFGHLRSIHNLFNVYDNNKPWVTHASIQNGSAVESDVSAVLFRDVWRKPVVYDEVKYEGNLIQRWGNLTGQEMVRRLWEGTIAGTYVGHGESLADEGHRMFLGEGGKLKGESPARFAFFRRAVIDEAPIIDPIDKWQDRHLGGVPGRYYLRYFGDTAPKRWDFMLPKEALSDGQKFAVDVIDTWNMTITPIDGVFTIRKANDYEFVSDRAVELPGKPWIALRIRRLT